MRLARLAGAALVVAGCGGGGNGGGGGTPPPAAVSSVAITPSAGQSVNVGGTVAFSAQPRDGSGNNLTRAVSWTTSDASKVSLSATTGASVTATGVAAGSSNIRATSDGVQSAQVLVTVNPGGGGPPPPSSASVAATGSNTFDPSSVTIAAGGTVTWTFGATEHNVTFTGSAPPGGNIGNMTSTNVSRTFPNPGAYPYNCTLHAGMNGTVTVVQP